MYIRTHNKKTTRRSQQFSRTFSQHSQQFSRTFSQHSQQFSRTFSQHSQQFSRTFSQHSQHSQQFVRAMSITLELKTELINWRVNVDNLKATNVRLREIFRGLVKSAKELDELYRDEIENIFLESFGEEAISIMRETEAFRTEHNKTPEKQQKMAQRRKLLDRVRHYYNKLRSDISTIFEGEEKGCAVGELVEEMYECTIEDEDTKIAAGGGGAAAASLLEPPPENSPKQSSSAEKPDICPICHQTLTEADTVLTQPCGHSFHRDCLKAHFQHLKRKPKECSICRQLITHYIDGGEDIPAQRARGRPRGSIGRRPITLPNNEEEEQKEETTAAAEEEDDDVITRLLYRTDIDPRTLPANEFDTEHPYYTLYIRMCNIANGTEPWQNSN